MPHLFLLGLQVSKGVSVRRHFARDLLDNIDACINQGAILLGIVREEAHPADTKPIIRIEAGSMLRVEYNPRKCDQHNP